MFRDSSYWVVQVVGWVGRVDGYSALKLSMRLKLRDLAEYTSVLSFFRAGFSSDICCGLCKAFFRAVALLATQTLKLSTTALPRTAHASNTPHQSHHPSHTQKSMPSAMMS